METSLQTPSKGNGTSTAVKVAYAKGDGIGPEIMDATLRILEAAGARIDFEEVTIGEQVYLSGNTSGIDKHAWDTIRKNKVFLKAPITTPRGGGYKSLNVTIRKSLGLYANVRPCNSLSPFVQTLHPNMDVVIVRENEEDLYAGIEHQQTDEVVQCLKLITRPGVEKIVRYAFEFAKVYNRKKVTCFVKDNIMKHTDGLFSTVFQEIAAEYPNIESQTMIVDIGAAKLANRPEDFDVVVMPNLYGDIISDIAAEISGSVGLAGSSNIGMECAMFEAIHGSAPDISGQNIANPSGLLRGAIMMLNHIGQPDVAEKIENAWLATIENGIHTADIFNENHSTKKVGTREFADAVISHMGHKPNALKAVSYEADAQFNLPAYKRPAPKNKEFKGVDVFVDWKGEDVNDLASMLNEIEGPLKLSMITNRGVKVWPEGFSETFCTDHWRCRFENASGAEVTSKTVAEVLSQAYVKNIDVIKTENLYTFDGERGYSLGQGQ